MRITVKNIIDVSLVLIFFAGYQGGKYFFHNRFQEIGIAITLSLFLYSAIKVAISGREERWAWWFWSAPLLVLYTMGIASITFSVYSETPTMLSFFATREFLIVFLAPTLYFIYKLGYPIERLERVFVISLVIIIFNYLLHYFRIDLQAAYFSGDGYMEYLVTHDEWRGYRLKPPTFALFIITLYIFMYLFQKRTLLKKCLWFLMLCIVGYVWFLIKARSQMATMALAMMIYPFLFSRPNRINILLLVAPIVLSFIMLVSAVLIENFVNEDRVRAKSFSTAIENINKYPILGYGQGSNFGKNYQDIFGPKFFPSDLGIIGITFKYGFTGAFLYFFFNFFLFKRLIQANWHYRHHYQSHDPVIWALLVWITAMTINLILNPGLAYMQGLTTASFVIGLTACYQSVLLKSNRTLFLENFHS
ncbi:MAG: hypothetical protein LC437_09465 [Thiohalomonas sp.]|nr:hypothetical protein [Thiohalomonas sp.]